MRILLFLALFVLPATAQQSPPLDPEVVDSRGCGPGQDGKVFCTNDPTVWIGGDLPYNHSTCRAFFEVLQGDEHMRPIGLYDYWPEGWDKWWKGEKSKKKYPGFCYERNQHRPHYVIFWANGTGPYAATYINVWVARSSDIAPALAANRDPAIYRSAPARGKQQGLEDVFKFIA